MKLIQVNTWLGHLMHPLLNYIDQEQPDIICAQEILQSDSRNPLFDVYNTGDELAKRFPYHFFAPTYDFESLGAKVMQGNAIYSRFPITDPETHFITGKYQSNQLTANFARNIRNLQICTITLPDSKALTVANHHGFHDLNPLGNQRTVEALECVADQLATKPRPLIFCGDLNVNPSSPALKALDKLKLHNLSTLHKLPATLSTAHRIPNSQEIVCDYVFISEEIKVVNFTASEVVISDHKPLVLEFEL